MLAEWDVLSEDLQLTLCRVALRRAVETLASQAEILAEEIETGGLCDRGGADALRLFAALARVNADESLPVVGHG
jgi:hypothetical protein